MSNTLSSWTWTLDGSEGGDGVMPATYFLPAPGKASETYFPAPADCFHSLLTDPGLFFSRSSLFLVQESIALGMCQDNSYSSGTM